MIEIFPWLLIRPEPSTAQRGATLARCAACQQRTTSSRRGSRFLAAHATCDAAAEGALSAPDKD